MPAVNPKQLRYEGIQITDNDFTAGKDEGDELAAGEVGEVAVAEVGEDGQLSSYDAVRLGDRPDAADPTKGKVFMALANAAAEDLPNTTQVRYAFRDKNSNRRTPATPWIPLRDLDNDRPDHRKVLRPRERNGKPWYLKMGRLLVIEVKNESQAITFDLGNSEIETPSRAGF